MGLVDLLLKSGGGDLISQVAREANTSGKGAEDLLSTLGSALFGQVKGRIESSNHDSSTLEELIQSSKYANMVDDPSSHIKNERMVDDGNDVLSYITGSKEGSREVASQVAEKTGFDLSIVKSLLPMIAPIVIGSLSKSFANDNSDNVSRREEGSSGLIGMLDFDNDGSVLDDVAGLAMKYIF